jgi:anti-sigma regulatory factor (Ser/Thr protein kinase)
MNRYASEYEIEVIADRRAASFARASLAQLSVLRFHQRIDEVLLATSELVSNAVLHGDLREGVDSIRVTVHVGEGSVRVAVQQPTPAEGVAIVNDPDLGRTAPGGFGLRLVDELVDEWGYEAGPPGRVWFESRSTGPR